MQNKLSLLFIITFLALLHLGAFYAFFFYFDWAYLILTLLAWQIFAFIGISMCYHRELTHRSYEAVLPLRIFHLVCATIAGQAGPILWCQVHRIHHRYSDREGDPHSPVLKNFFFAHLGWIFFQKERRTHPAFQVKYQDLHDDKILRFFQLIHFPAFFIIFIALYSFLGIKGLLWLGCVRVMLTLHSAWMINSLGHTWGYQNYKDKDHSRNSKLVAMLTGGEGLHNNHHHAPHCVNMNHVKGEFDPGLYYIRFMKKLGLVSKVREYS